MGRGRDQKVRHKYTILCDQVIIDKEDHPTVVRAVGNLAFEGLPGIAPRLGVLVGFSAPEGDAFSVTIEDPKRRQIVQLGEGEVKQRPEADVEHLVIHTAFVCNVQNATFQTEGVHSIVLRVGGRVVHRSAFGVGVMDPGRQKG